MSERKVKCPQCGLHIEYKQENAFRPFCSERCKLIDLGQWASENFKIPTAEIPQVYQEQAESDTGSEDPET